MVFSYKSTSDNFTTEKNVDVLVLVVDLYPVLIDIDDTLVDQLSAWEGHPISTE